MASLTEKQPAKYAVLRLSDLLFVVKDDSSDPDTENFVPRDDDKKYYYEEHSCPVNFLGSVVEIWRIHDDHLEIDPHGMFKFMGMINDFIDDGNSPDWQNRMDDKLVRLLGDPKIKLLGVD